jgi:predicted NAD/FAD-binding protein
MPKTTPTSTRPRVVIIGAGAAGVFTAYRLREMYGDRYDIVLLEKAGRIGGNVSSTQVKFGKNTYSIDCGAQFFYKYPQASYVGLLGDLGLFDKPRRIEAKATGITIWDRKKREHRLWIPSHARGFLRYRAADWDRMTGFATFLAYAFLLDRDQPDNWTLRLDKWVSGLKLLDRKFKDEILRAFLYQFVTLPAKRIDEASALYAITYFVRTVFGEEDVDEPDPRVRDPRGIETFEVYQSTIGLDGVLELALDHAGVTPRLRQAVTAVRKKPGGRLEVCTAAEKIPADHVVFATDPQVAAKILSAGKLGAPGLVACLQACEYDDLPISMQKGGSCWMPSDTRYWNAVNTIVDGDDLHFTAWFGPLRDTYGVGKKIPVFKSWATPDLDPESCGQTFLAHEHRILMPTAEFMKHRAKVQACQGKDHLWFAGGWTNWFDSQEAALDSATEVAERLPGTPMPGSGRAAMVPGDRDRDRKRIDRWLARVAARAPRERRKKLKELMKEVEAKG